MADTLGLPSDSEDVYSLVSELKIALRTVTSGELTSQSRDILK